MTTNIEVITVALRDLNVIGEAETPSPEQGAYCLGQLNDMLEAWTEININLGYFKQSNTTDVCPVPAWSEQGVKAKLAEVVAGHYGAAITLELQRKIDSGYGLILRKCVVENLNPANMDHMSAGSGHVGSGFDITTG